MNWEVCFLRWIQNLRSPRRNRFWYTVTWFGYAASLPLLASVLLLLSPAYRMTGLASLTAVGRIPRDKSFPSGHTSSAFACALILFSTLPIWLGICAIVIAAMIAFSRLYLAVHYPTDILGGIIAAVLVDCVVMKLF